MNTDSFVEDGLQSAVSQSLASAVEQSCPVSSLSASQPASSTTSANSPLSAQYSQFLASVRDFKPLVADLNTSIASIANSVTTVGADVGSRVTNVNVTGSKHYVADMGLYSSVSHAPQHEPSVMPDENSQRCQIVHNDDISHNSGKVQIRVVTLYVSYDSSHKIILDAVI